MKCLANNKKNNNNSNGMEMKPEFYTEALPKLISNWWSEWTVELIEKCEKAAGRKLEFAETLFVVGYTVGSFVEREDVDYYVEEAVESAETVNESIKERATKEPIIRYTAGIDIRLSFPETTREFLKMCDEKIGYHLNFFQTLSALNWTVGFPSNIEVSEILEALEESNKDDE